jgi:hypothetical protein
MTGMIGGWGGDLNCGNPAMPPGIALFIIVAG